MKKKIFVAVLVVFLFLDFINKQVFIIFFDSGVVKIKDLGNDKYKFTFSNVVVKNDLEVTKTINGVFVVDFVQP